MACLEPYCSSSSAKNSVPMSPRISFSNGFVESNHHNHDSKPNEAQSSSPSSDFEFSVSNNSMMAADELFFRGRLLPSEDSQKSITTLRQELLVADVDEDEEGSSNGFSLRPPKVSNKWKELLGLKKSSHVGSEKAHNPDVAFQGSPSLVRARSLVPQCVGTTSFQYQNCPKPIIHLPTNAEVLRREKVEAGSPNCSFFTSTGGNTHQKVKEKGLVLELLPQNHKE